MDRTEKITALLITLNEEKHIKEVLENLSFCDEIIVVDSFSTDNTTKIIANYPHVKLIQRAFKNYTDQKQFALDQATNNWVLFMDADERVTPKLKNEIEVTINLKSPAAAYYFLRTFMYKNKVLRFSGWQTDKNYRLFQKNKVKFVKDRIVHETLEVNGVSKTLKNKLIHYSFNSYSTYKDKMIKYGEMKAKEAFYNGKKARWYHSIFRPFWKFINHYILRFGFLDGKRGIVICYLNALGVHSRYKELKRLQKSNLK
ncbi:glycosyltransferase family 2 protein [Croceivirga sp. JEA036]|uniref:glycosyltransferase family 2 protein n=1 Tax=Croceivirga sp. JEA036 TaxID=2721162 RepID=UPI00143C92BB|nr:glycosyltransferase family 2 protein [Croceivirga sp. JEA036]NJB37531.1 glycosyltransferase family 2 protein [Croceivirga sp. JEA036]